VIAVVGESDGGMEPWLAITKNKNDLVMDTDAIPPAFYLELIQDSKFKKSVIKQLEKENEER